MQYKSLIYELIDVANRIGSNNDGCMPANIIPDGRVCKDCNCNDCRIDAARYIRDLADSLALAHKAELKTLKKRYKTDLREAREARDIAIKEASKLRNDVNLAKDLVHDFRSDIAIMLGISCDGMADEVQEAIDSELHKRLMPPGMEWPKDRNENPFDPRKLYDSGCGAVDFVRIGFLNGEQWASVESHDGIDLLPEELGDCEPEVLGADGVPIKFGETMHSTYDGDWSAVKSVAIDPIGYTVYYDGVAMFTLSDSVETMMRDLMSRQRELDARTMGGDAS